MVAVTYQLLYGTMPLQLTYIQLEMADQTFQKVEDIVTNVPVKIDDYFVHTDFQVIDMGEDEYVPQHCQSYHLHWNQRSPHALPL